MLKILLVTAGVLNLLFALFHIFLAYQIHGWVALPDQARDMVTAFNTGCTFLLFFLAYVCLLRGREMLSTGLGGAVLALGALVYLTRAGEEWFLFGGNMAIFGACLAAGLLHAVLVPFVRLSRTA